MPIYYPTVDGSGNRIPNPSRPITEGIASNLTSFTGDSGWSQRRNRGSNVLTWEYTYNVLFDGAYTTLKNFYAAMTMVNSFIWIHPITKVTYTVIFDMPAWSGEYIGHSGKGPLWKVSVKLKQV